MRDDLDFTGLGRDHLDELEDWDIAPLRPVLGAVQEWEDETCLQLEAWAHEAYMLRKHLM